MSELGNVDRAEAAARGGALEAYGAHLKLTARVYDFIGKWSNSDELRPFSEISLAERVCAALLFRLANDLRCVQEEILRGYSLQAVSLVASMFEGSYILSFIGNDDVLAKSWVEHDDPTRTFRRVKELIRGVMQKEKVPDVDASTEARYLDYRQLCLAKHINPLLQKQHGIGSKSGPDGSTVIVFSMGPDTTSDAAIRAAWFALEQAAILALMAFSTYLREIAGPGALPSDARSEMAKMAKRHKLLRNKAKERWGTIDPFPGRW